MQRFENRVTLRSHLHTHIELQNLLVWVVGISHQRRPFLFGRMLTPIGEWGALSSTI
jgi:hypothetical protein